MKNICIDFVLDDGIVKAKLFLPRKGYFIIDTPISLTPQHWDRRLQRPLNIYIKTFKRINEALDRIRIALASWARDIVTSMSRKEIERSMFNRVARAYKKSSLPSDKRMLLYHVHAYINARKHLLSPATRKRYHVFLALLQRFEGYAMRHFTIREVNALFVQRFLAFGENEQYSLTTLHRSIAFVRTVLHFLEKRGVRTMSHELELPRIRKRNNLVTLSETELELIKNVTLPAHLQHARDWLIISCYTGQRISDFMRFRPDMLCFLQDTACIAFCQQKTSRDILLPLHPEVLHIMKQHADSFPLPIPPQRYNQLIREVTRLAGLNSITECCIRQGHRASRKNVPKWMAISSHIGRRSFATNFYGKIPTSLLMEATGHASERMFQRYINHRDSSQVLSLAAYMLGKAS